jgi:hypothetical protein
MKTFIGSIGQRGSVLLIAILLLLLASIVGVLTLNVGTLEQRSSGADMRAKAVQQLADTALSQGIEVINANKNLLTNQAVWAPCAANDVTFPCGSVEPGVAVSARRGTMLRFTGGTGDNDNDGTPDTAFDQRMLPLPATAALGRVMRVNNTTATANDGFQATYGAGAVLCRLLPAAAGVAPACTQNWNEPVRMTAVTVVGVAGLTNEGARATVSKTISTYPNLGLGSSQPPLMASGTIDITGTMQLVTNPNGGGTGVPVSVWTRRNVDASGTPDTCYADEFFRLGAKSNSPPSWYPSGETRANQTLTCDDCSCPSGGTLSSVSGSACGEGPDILDVDSNACGVARDTVPTEFPCDTFRHIFGIPAWRDTDSDNFCETRITVEDMLRGGVWIGADENYLRENADWIIKSGTDAAFENTFDPAKVVAAAAIGPSTSGIVWDRTGGVCDNRTIGSPAAPVILVADGAVSCQNLKLFGVLFVRSTGPGPLNVNTGGNATFRLNAGSVIYGAAMVQGVVDKANGTAAIVHDAKVLSNLINDPDGPRLVGLPGSWSDAVRY